MKIFHLSDLHIGRQLNGYSLKENQEAILEKIAEAAGEYRPDVILICGDIYDKAAPSGEAYDLFNHFLEKIGGLRPEVPVLIIAGNHDSPERLRFAASFLEQHQIYISVLPPMKEGEFLKKVTLKDEYGPVNFYMLPFTRPGYVRGLWKEERKGLTYEEAVKAVLEREEIHTEERNVLLSHQFYTAQGVGPETCGSEIAVSIGGLDSIDIQVSNAFDYTALGHLHGAQKAGRENARYCGSPFPYSISEEKHQKGITLIDMGTKGEPLSIKQIPLKGIQNVRTERGSLEEVLRRATEENRHDFVSITLTDDDEAYHFREKLEETYDYLLEVRIDNERVRKLLEENDEEREELSPIEAFQEFFQTVRERPMTEEEKEAVKRIAACVQDEEKK